jgi:hypothetical protein
MSKRKVADMKHPKPEEWMAFLYDEDDSSRRVTLQAHLESCEDCASRVKIWRDSMQSLDEWPAPSRGHSTVRFQPLLKLAAAALLMIGFGFAIGQAARPSSVDVAALKAELARDFDARLTATVASSSSEVQRLLAEFMQAQDDHRSVDREAIVAALRQLDAKYAANVAALRTELETVAVNTQDGLLETHQQLGLLASYAQPSKADPEASQR